MGHDIDGVIFIFALFFQFLLSQVPSFLDGGDRNLSGAADVVEVARQRDQDDRVFMGQAEEVEGDEEGDGEVCPQGRFHFFHRIVFEAVHVDSRFFDVPGFHDGDDDAAVFDSHFSRVIAFAALVEADVAGIAAGAGDDDVCFFFHRDALDVENGFGASPPCVVPVTADHAADFAVAVDDGVDEEARIDLAAGFDHVVVERVVVDLEGPRLGVDAVTKFVSQSVAVVALDRFETGNAGQDEFAAAAVTGEEMGRNAIDDDDFVGVDNVFVEFQRRAELGRAAVDEGRVHAVMLIGLDAADDFFTADADVFFRRLGAVRTLSEDNADVVIGDAGQVQFVDDVDEELI